MTTRTVTSEKWGVLVACPILGTAKCVKQTHAKQMAKQVREEGRHPFLIPAAGGYFYVGVADTPGDAKRLGVEAIEHRKQCEAAAREAVRERVKSGTAGLTNMPAAVPAELKPDLGGEG